MTIFGDIYKNKKVLVTGHTGFKGSWLITWLEELGAEVSGIALNPTSQNNHYNLLKPIIKSYIQNIKDSAAIQKIFDEVQPEIVFHLAAQALVKYSYEHPLETFETNVTGTANILHACKNTKSVKAAVIVTSDKCYLNQETTRGYKETDPLGGSDPYSSSKACAELVTQSYKIAYFSDKDTALIATARAGNVVGGGDQSPDRLIPDIIKAIQANQPVIIRSPDSVRPWQHVLDSLSGYLVLGQKLLEGHRSVAEPFNFGPFGNNPVTVKDVITLAQESNEFKVEYKPSPEIKETKTLLLDSSKAKSVLGWMPVWDERAAISKTFEWYKDKSVPTLKQIYEYVRTAKERNIQWTR